jgi:hypothetical protein
MAETPFRQQWRPLRFVQREKREKTAELWRKLDDVVTDAIETPSPRKPRTLLTPTPPPPLLHQRLL